ncbi:MAG: uracil-DNA glycosylase family protein [Verrucomicrobiota bacterium]
MTKTDYSDKTEDLFNRWKRERPEYQTNGSSFLRDGIPDYELWSVAKPKIMFLLKEAIRDDGWEPVMGIIDFQSSFAINLARWHQVLKLLLIDCSNVPTLSQIDKTLRFPIRDLALVEVKKATQGLSKSEYADIMAFAERDKDYLEEQINIIQPEVIVCCGDVTYDAYWKHLWGRCDEDSVSLSKHNTSKYDADKHGEIIVINSYHPSTPGRDEEMYSRLCETVRDGRLFKHFNWANR